jgi:hypothetical protein
MFAEYWRATASVGLRFLLVLLINTDWNEALSDSRYHGFPSVTSVCILVLRPYQNNDTYTTTGNWLGDILAIVGDIIRTQYHHGAVVAVCRETHLTSLLDF